MITWIRLVSMVCLLAFGCGSEDYTAVETDRSPLITGFESYAAREEVTAKLASQGGLKVVEDASLAQDSSTPPYRIYALSATPYTHLGHRGRLVITFFNNRLMKTAFYPEKLDDYLNTLRRNSIPIDFAQELVNGHTVAWIGTDFDNKYYVGWADKRLREQQRRWLARYQ